MRQLRWFGAVVLLLGTVIVSVAFVIANRDNTPLQLPFVRPIEAPLWLIVTAAFFLGALTASAGLLFQLGRKSLAVRRSEKRLRGLEDELVRLRAAAPAIAAGDGAPPVRSAP
jgi:uncharacterized integral membrane protein